MKLLRASFYFAAVVDAGSQAGDRLEKEIEFAKKAVDRELRKDKAPEKILSEEAALLSQAEKAVGGLASRRSHTTALAASAAEVSSRTGLQGQIDQAKKAISELKVRPELRAEAAALLGKAEAAQEKIEGLHAATTKDAAAFMSARAIVKSGSRLENEIEFAKKAIDQELKKDKAPEKLRTEEDSLLNQAAKAVESLHAAPKKQVLAETRGHFEKDIEFAKAEIDKALKSEKAPEKLRKEEASLLNKVEEAQERIERTQVAEHRHASSLLLSKRSGAVAEMRKRLGVSGRARIAHEVAVGHRLWNQNVELRRKYKALRREHMILMRDQKLKSENKHIKQALSKLLQRNMEMRQHLEA